MTIDLRSLRARRIVTGHDHAGHAVIAADEELEAEPLAELGVRPGAAFFQMWTTHEMPVDVSDKAMRTQRRGSRSTVAGTGSGSVLRIGVLAPGVRSPMHRTESIDYGICLQGECDMELDGGDVVTVRAGDVVVQRGTNHLWHNRSDRPCRFAWVLLDAQAVTVAGARLGTSWEPDA